MAPIIASTSPALLATHDMAEAEKMTDRVAILLRGKIAATGAPRELTATGSGFTKVSVHSEEANSRATLLWSQLIFLPSMLLGGLMLPLSLIPPAIRPISALLPSTYAMQAFEGLAFGRPTVFSPWLSAGILLASTLLAVGLAVYLFNWDSRNQTRRGHPLMALLVLVPYLLGILLSR